MMWAWKVRRSTMAATNRGSGMIDPHTEPAEVAPAPALAIRGAWVAAIPFGIVAVVLGVIEARNHL
jgi:hypothetical protein